MNRIDRFFEQATKAFVPYITAGHPTAGDTLEIMKLLAANGGDIIELGFPFSDPTADGPVIQASSQAALTAGFTRARYFDLIREFRQTDAVTPVMAFTYFNPIFNMGVAAYARELAAAGGDAVLIVDLPFEEQDEVLPALHEHGLYLIQLIAPNTPMERARKILARGEGFIYQIALKGVTGMRSELGAGAAENAHRTRALTDLPVCMGFGVSNGDMARQVAAAADGVVVGSALVKCIADNLPDYQTPLQALIQELANGTHAG